MTIHHTLTILLIAAFIAALAMQWLLMRRMGKSLEQFQRQKLIDYTRRNTQPESGKGVSAEAASVSDSASNPVSEQESGPVSDTVSDTVSDSISNGMQQQ